MKSSDLKCPTCGAGPHPESVRGEFEIPAGNAILWLCQNRHRHISGWRSLTPEQGPLQHLAIQDDPTPSSSK